MKQLISGQRQKLSTRSSPKELGALSGTQGMHAEMPSFRTTQAGGGGKRVRGGWGLGILLFFSVFPHLTKLPAFHTFKKQQYDKSQRLPLETILLKRSCYSTSMQCLHKYTLYTLFYFK